MKKKKVFFLFCFFIIGCSQRSLRKTLQPSLKRSMVLKTHVAGLSAVKGAHIWPTKVPFIPHRSARFRYLGSGKHITWRVLQKDAQGHFSVPPWMVVGKAEDPIFFKNPLKEEMIFKAPRHTWGFGGIKTAFPYPKGVVAWVIEATDELNQTAQAELSVLMDAKIPFYLPEQLDPYFKDQHGLGSHVVLPEQQRHFLNNDYAIKNLSGVMAPEAWSIQKDCHEVITAIIDDGVDYTHRDLNGSVLGYVDRHGKNVMGLNMRHPHLSVDLGVHGTHIAGIVGGLSNGWGILGMCHRAALLPIQVLSSKTKEDSTALLSFALNIVADYKGKHHDHKIRVSNFSLGYDGYADRMSEEDFDKEHAAYVLSQTHLLKPGIQKLAEQQSMLIMAAGNDGINLDQYWTASSYFMGEPHVMAIAATDLKGEKASFSNYGMHTVDLAAPGKDILSTAPFHHFMFASGTSMAAPFVSGLVALMMNHFAHLTSQQIKIRICLSSDYVEALDPMVRFGFVNAYRALAAEFEVIEGDPFVHLQ